MSKLAIVPATGSAGVAHRLLMVWQGFLALSLRPRGVREEGLDGSKQE